jgi:hypothetical protein
VLNLVVLGVRAAMWEDDQVLFSRFSPRRSFARLKERPQGKADLGTSAVTSKDPDPSCDLEGDLGSGARLLAFGLRDRNDFG